MSLTYERASELLSYDHTTGILTWKVRKGCRGAGQRAGNTNTLTSTYRFRSIGIDGRNYLEHRVAWLLHYGAWPECNIDHIDHDATNNRIENLRLSPNNQADNQTHLKLRTDNRSGCAGVSWHTKAGKWRARIFDKGKEIHLGLFTDKEEAMAKYAEAKRKYHPFAADYQKEAA